MATTDKYDRQLRLWGSHGQRALMNSHILLIGADAAGSETLKNLILPGVGKFTIVDSDIVTEKDLGTNFFVLSESVGSSKADCVKQTLSELNPDAEGFSYSQSIDSILEADAEFLSQFTLIICSNVFETSLLPIADICWSKAIPLVSVTTYGNIGMVRLQMRCHNVMESKTTYHTDFRLHSPFPEFKSYCDAIDLTAISANEIGNVPYLVLLYKALESWKASHDGLDPTGFQEQRAFKDYVKTLYGKQFDSNFSEVKDPTKSDRAFKKDPHYHVQNTFAHHKQLQADGTPDLSNFGIMLMALESFMEQSDGCVPLNAELPDMSASTKYFLELQTIYHEKSTKDKALMRTLVDDLLAKHCQPLLQRVISDEELSIFCKNVHHMCVVSTRSIREEYTNPHEESLGDALDDRHWDAPAQTPILWYLALRGAGQFRIENGRAPGSGDDMTAEELDADTEIVWAKMQEFASRAAPSQSEAISEMMTRDHAAEITRYGACHIHNISAAVAGVASTEIVKLITHQFIPLNNTFIYNGIASVFSQYEL